MLSMKDIYAMNMNQAVNVSLRSKFEDGSGTNIELAPGIYFLVWHRLSVGKKMVYARIDVDPYKCDKGTVHVIYDILHAHDSRKDKEYRTMDDFPCAEKWEKIDNWYEVNKHGTNKVDFLHR